METIVKAETVNIMRTKKKQEGMLQRKYHNPQQSSSSIELKVSEECYR